MSRKIKNNAPVAAATPADKKKSKLLIAITSVFLSLLIVFGAVFGIVIAVRNARYVMSYETVGVDSGVASYLSSYYKAVFMKAIAEGGQAVDDNDEFWNQVVSEGKTVGDYLKAETEKYIKNVIGANYIFNRYAKLTAAEKEDIELAVSEKLQYSAGGSVTKFNEQTAKYGFDYDDFRVATEMLYKATAVKDKVFGENGESMMNFPELCDEYFEKYNHVKLLFVRTETEFVLDDNGNRIPDDEGNDKLIELSDAQKAEKAELVEHLMEIIDNVNAGKADAEVFDRLLKDYDEGDRTLHTKGYYFNTSSEYTREFSEEFSSVTQLSNELVVGQMGYVDCSVGVCFIYKIPREDKAYTDTQTNWCFSDFFSLAASEALQDMLDDIREEIKPKEKWSLIDPIKIPYNTDYVARF